MTGSAAEVYSPTETLAPSERCQHQESWLRKLAEHAFANAPATRRKLEAAGLGPADLGYLDRLPRVPITRKDDLIELQAAEPPFGGLLGVPLQKLRHIFQSPGPILDPQGL